MSEITSAIIKTLITDDNETKKYVYPRTVADAIIMDSNGTLLFVKKTS